MKQRPIILPPATVQGILAGTITQHIILIGKNLDLLPKYHEGDQLYVRETWATHLNFDHIKPSDLDFENDHHAWIWFQANDPKFGPFGKWRPPIQMPKAAARIWLEVTGIRMERLQNITEADAVAVGFPGGGTWDTAPTIQFSNEWDSRYCHAPSESNPWVYIITSKKITITAAPAAQTTTA